MTNFPPQAAEELVQKTPFQNKIKTVYRLGLYLFTGSKYSDMDEQTVIEDVIDEARDEDVIFDVGAAGGLYSYYPVNEVGCAAHAFEPHPESFVNLLDTVENIASITPHQVALSDSSGEVQFEDNEGSLASPSIATDPNTADSGTTVNCTRGDEYIRQEGIDTPTIVKIDVEGAEMDVLRGMRETLANDQCRLVYVEVHLPTDDESPDITDFGADPSDVSEFLDSLGYETERLLERDRDFHIKANNQTE